MKRMLSLLLAVVLTAAMATPVFGASSTAKSVLKQVNEARESADLNTLKLDDDLMAAAELRAKELSTNYAVYGVNHSRPDGSKYYSLSPLVWAENAAYGYHSADQVMSAWMKSSGHKANILDERMTIMGVAYYETSESIYWVQLYGNGKSNGVWTKIDWSEIDTTKPNAVTKESTVLIDENGGVTAKVAASNMKKALQSANGGTVSIRIKNAKTISPAALAAVNDAAVKGGKKAVIYADTMNASGKAVQGRLTLETAKLLKRTKDLKVGVYTDSDSVSATKSAMAKKYSGTKMAFVSMSHKGSLGASVKVSAKVSLTGMDQKALKFYLYDAKKGALTLIENTNYTVDNNGFINFYTTTGGEVVITDQAL